jgi:hypothetical protein
MVVSGKSDRINLESDPAGATAYADGSELGTTPLAIVPGEHFRSGFAGLSYRYQGKLTFRRPGCEPHTIEVNDYILSRDVHAKLKCDPDFRPPAAVSGQAQVAPTSDKPMDRLERIEALRKKGLISDEEYGNLRKRVIDEL